MINLASDNVNSVGKKMCAVQEGTGASASEDIADRQETGFRCI